MTKSTDPAGQYSQRSRRQALGLLGAGAVDARHRGRAGIGAGARPTATMC